MPGFEHTTAEWQRLDAAHFLHPFTDFQALAAKGSRVITKGDNVYLWDSDGHKLFDAMSGLWCVNVGYGQKALIDAATQQLTTLPFYNAFFQTTTPPAVALAHKLSTLTPPPFQHVFFSGSGSEGNDTVVRLVRRYWDVLGQPQRHTIISRFNAYHGSTMAGASLGGMTDMHAQGGLPIPGITHIDQPYFVQHGKPGESKDEFGIRAAQWLEAKILEVGPDKVAAFIGEPVQRICDQYGILLVSDEVICGFGRTGHWFGCERFGYKPDLMTFAKGVTSGYIPLGGVMVGERVARVLIEQGGEFAHGYTYSGHPVACAVALANLELIEREGLVQRVHDETGPRLAQAYAELASHPLVAEAETCGLMGAIRLVKRKAQGSTPAVPFPSDQSVGMVCRGHCFGNGLVMRAVGDRMIVAPPLVMTVAQVDEMVGLIRHCLDLTLADLKARGWVD
jgi:putrescine aminotransferase